MRAGVNYRAIVISILVVAVIAIVLPNLVPAFQPSITAATAANQGSCDRQMAAGRNEITIFSEGGLRTFLAYVPKGYDGKTRLPLVLNLHGSGGSGAIQETTSQLEPTADKHKFIIAAPDGALRLGSGYAWNVPEVPLLGGQSVPVTAADDVRYLGDVIDAIEQKLCVDSDRVYAAGYSSGARLASQLACDMSNRIAAIAPIAGLRAGAPAKNGQPDPSSCHPARPVPVIAFHGMTDPVNPYVGGGQRYWYYPVDTAEQRWSVLDGCAGPSQVTKVSAHVNVKSYTACRNKARVELYSITNGGHTWPGSNTQFPPSAGLTTHEINANELMWSFFSQYQLSSV